jgi:L-lactate utilization protein LutC
MYRRAIAGMRPVTPAHSSWLTEQESSIVQTVPEAITRLQSSARLPTTFVSGPSATADIEMTRIKGVHGPRNLDVVIVIDLA